MRKLYDENGNVELYDAANVRVNSDGTPLSIYGGSITRDESEGVIDTTKTPTLYPIETDGKNLFVNGDMINPNAQYPDENTGSYHLLIRRLFAQ